MEAKKSIHSVFYDQLDGIPYFSYFIIKSLSSPWQHIWRLNKIHKIEEMIIKCVYLLGILKVVIKKIFFSKTLFLKIEKKPIDLRNSIN